MAWLWLIIQCFSSYTYLLINTMKTRFASQLGCNRNPFLHILYEFPLISIFFHHIDLKGKLPEPQIIYIFIQINSKMLHYAPTQSLFN